MTKPISHYDIVIIGSGIAGATLASRLNKGQSVCILETESTTAYHSTGRSAAMFIKNYGNAAIRQLNRISEDYFVHSEKLFCPRDLLSQRGELVICPPNQEALWNKRLQDIPESTSISVAEAHQLVPLLKKGKVAAAVYDELAADIDVDLLHQSAIKKAKKNGVEVLLNHKVTSLCQNKDGWNIDIATQNQQIKKMHGSVVINAAGAWASEIAEMAGASNQYMQPMRRSAAIVSAPEAYYRSDGPLFAPLEENWYAKPQSGQLLVSPSEEIPVEAHDAYVDDMVMAEGLYRFESYVNMSVTRLDHQWAGLRTFTKDRTPVLGFDDKLSNFFWLAGQGGYGIQTSPALSMIASSILQQEHDEWLNSEPIKTLLPQLSPNRVQV